MSTQDSLERLRACALSVSTRYFRAPIYLVGSAVDPVCTPRDIDVVVVLEDDVFEVVYGAGVETVAAWHAGHGTANPPAIWLRWARDCAKQGLELSRLCRAMVDFKVQPSSFFNTFTQPTSRLDAWSTP